MKSMKLLSILLIPLVLSGCYLKKLDYSDKRMQQEAERLCRDHKGIYSYGHGVDYGIVKCFRNLKKFNVFTGEEVK